MVSMDGPIYSKVAPVCLVIAFLLHLICFGAPHWAKSNPRVSMREDHIGLWKYCTYVQGGGDVCNDFIDITTGDWLKAAQSFMTLGFFGLLACLGFVIPNAFLEDNMLISAGSIVSTAVTGVFVLIGVAVMGGKSGQWFRDHEPNMGYSGVLGWAFGVGVASCFLIFVTLGLVITQLIEERKEPPPRPMGRPGIEREKH